MNARAAANASKVKSASKHPEKFHCARCACFGRQTPSDRAYIIYDIFSDDPKDVLYLCDNCDGQSGDPWEGYFTCADCSRVMVENYTWERYCTTRGDDTVCLACAAKEHFAEAANWIDPRAVVSVELEPEGGPLFADGVLNVARCRHVLGVSQPIPDSVCFVDNFEFDSMDGHQISGGDMLDSIHELSVPFCPVLDAAYQFAVSIGLYVRRVAAGKPFAGRFTLPGDNRALPVTFSKRYNTPRWAGIALDAGWERGALRIEGNPLVQVHATLEAAA